MIAVTRVVEYLNDLQRVICTRYRIDTFRKTPFVIDTDKVYNRGTGEGWPTDADV